MRMLHPERSEGSYARFFEGIMFPSNPFRINTYKSGEFDAPLAIEEPNRFA